jgi:membrane protease YdiL (CAAX protease family)
MSGRLVAWLAFTGILAAISYAGRYAADGEIEDDVLYEYTTAIGATIQYALMLGVLLWIAKGLPKREAFALRAPRSTGAAVGWAAVTLVAIYVVSGALSPFLDAGEEQGLTPDEWDPDRAGGYAANFVAVALFAPVVEELTYRGLGYTLLERYSRWVAIGVTALLFGLAHGLVIGLPVLVAFGVGLGWLRSKTGSVVPGMVLHGVFNAIALIVAVTLQT